MKIIIKTVLAIILIGSLLNMPYGYFQFVRIAGCIGFIYLAWTEFEIRHKIMGILFIGAAILLNPVFKVYLKRATWNTIDIFLAIGLLVYVIYDLSKHTK